MASLVHIYLAIFVLTAITVPCADALLGRYASLISDVHEYYGTSSVFFVMSSNNKQIQEYTLAHLLSREFSKKGILTFTIGSNEIVDFMNIYYKQVLRPLIVVLLGSVDDVNEFCQQTRELRISYPIWLIIFADELGAPVCEYCDKPRKNIFNVRFNTEMLVVCCKDPMLKEWWAIGNNEMETATFGRWTVNDGFKLLYNKSLYARRHEINGTGLRVVIVTNSAFLIDKGSGSIPGGFLGSVLEELKRVMNFEITTILRGNGYGSWNTVTRRWSGAIGQIANREADLGIAEFTVTNCRLDVVDFTLPLMLTRTQLYLRELDGSGVQWSAYFKAFTYEIWLSIIILVIVTTVSVTLIKMRAGTNTFSHLFLQHYLYVWGIFCQQGLAESPVETPLRIAYSSIFVSAWVLAAAYSASLISYLTVSNPTLPFSTLQEFAKDASYSLIVLQNSSDYDLFASSSDPVLSEMNSLMRPWNLLPQNLEDGFKQVCSEKVAFFTNEAMVKTLKVNLPCKIVQIETGRVDSLALILPSGSPYSGVVNYHIQRFQDNGMMNRLKHQYLMKIAPAETTYNEVTLWGIVPILSVLAGGIVLSLVVLLCEKLSRVFRKSGRNCRKFKSEKINSKIHRLFNDVEKPRELRLTSRFEWTTAENLNNSFPRYHP